MNRFHGILVIALLLGLAPRSVPAQVVDNDPDVIVQVRAKAIKEIINERITARLAGTTTRLTSVAIAPSPDGPEILDVTLAVVRPATYGGTTVQVPAKVKFEIFFGCNGNGPFIQPRNADVTVGIPGVPAATVAAIEADLNAMFAAARTPIINGLFAQLRTVKKAFSAVAPVCPKYDVVSNGGVRADLFFDTGCITGRTKVERCSPTQVGTGYNYRCDNGQWHQTGTDCRVVQHDPDPFPDHPPGEGQDPR